MIVKDSYLAKILKQNDLKFAISKIVFCSDTKKLALFVPKRSEPFYIYFDESLDRWIKLKFSIREAHQAYNLTKNIKKYRNLIHKVNFKIIEGPVVVKKEAKSFIDDQIWKRMIQLWNSEWGIMSSDGIPGFLDAKI